MVITIITNNKKKKIIYKRSDSFVFPTSMYKKKGKYENYISRNP